MSKKVLSSNDIITLVTISEEKLSVEDFPKKITGGTVMVRYSERNPTLKLTYKRLLSEGLIRISLPKESVDCRSISELTSLLKIVGYTKKGAKKDLVKQVKELLTDEEIENSEYYKPFFIITNLGEIRRNEYSGAIWFFKNADSIFGYAGNSYHFSIDYFISNPQLVPMKEMTEYFKERDFFITAQLYFIDEDFANSFAYFVKQAIKDLNKYIGEYIETRGYQRYFYENEFSGRFKASYQKLLLTDASFKNYIKPAYENDFEFKDMINLDDFSEIVHLSIFNNRDTSENLRNKISALIDMASPVDTESNQFKNQYFDTRVNEFIAQEFALLDLLIQNFDRKMLEELGKRIEMKIKEFDDFEID